MSDVETKDQKVAKKIDAALKAAPRDVDGNIEVQVTLLGDGVVATGELTSSGKPTHFVDGDKFSLSSDVARNLALKGYVGIAKPKAAKKAG